MSAGLAIEVSTLASRLRREACDRESAVRKRVYAAPCGLSTSHVRTVETEFVHAILEDPTGRSEQLRRPRLVEIRLLERLADDVALELVDGVREGLGAAQNGLARVFAALANAAVEITRKLVETDHRCAAAQHEQPLDHVLELAHIAGPVVCEQAVDERRR